MSLRGKINNIASQFQRANRASAMKGVMDSQGGVYGTRKILGYVCNVHPIDGDDELAGTVDVQEYENVAGEDKFEGVGHHEGVLVTAIQNNKSGVYFMPTMYSDVIIAQDPVSFEEYVIMCSHVDAIQLQSHKDIKIGVVETEEFQESDDDDSLPDYDELEETGKKAVTTYTKDNIRNEVLVDDEGVVEETTAEHKTIEVGDTKIFIDGTQITIETSNKVYFKVGKSEITEEDGKVTVKTDDVNVESKNTTIKADNAKVEAKDVKVDGKTVTITGGTLKTKGMSSTDLQGPFNAIKVCPFSGAPHCGSSVSGT